MSNESAFKILIRVNDELMNLAEEGDIATRASVSKIQVLLNALDDAIRKHIHELLVERGDYVTKEARPTSEDEIMAAGGKHERGA